MTVTDLIIDPRTIGASPLLVDVTPVMKYENRVRTDEIIGYKYTVALPAHNLDKLAVKIEGPKQMDAPNGYIEVQFKDLEIYVYQYEKKYEIGARAKGISPVTTK